jgi:formate hydrogenlyase subunit 3/multisubunit Na+/H+ antiporter MnhD subunit
METWLGKLLIAVGILCLLLGVFFLLLPKVPWLGRLPGDFRYQGERFSFYFPLVTCLIVSVVLTIVLNLIFRR